MLRNRGTLLCIGADFRCVAVRKLLLQTCGYRVLACTNPKEALATLAAEPITGVILDYYMPLMDGPELAAAMREIKPDVPIMMLAAHPAVPESATSAVDAVVTKAAPTEFLLSELEQMLA